MLWCPEYYIEVGLLYALLNIPCILLIIGTAVEHCRWQDDRIGGLRSITLLYSCSNVTLAIGILSSCSIPLKCSQIWLSNKTVQSNSTNTNTTYPTGYSLHTKCRCARVGGRNYTTGRIFTWQVSLSYLMFLLQVDPFKKMMCWKGGLNPSLDPDPMGSLRLICLSSG